MSHTIDISPSDDVGSQKHARLLVHDDILQHLTDTRISDGGPDVGLEDYSISLPTPVTASISTTAHVSLKPSSIPAIHVGGSKIQPTTAVIVPIWILFSSSVIIYNNYIYNTLNFRYPVFLVSWHLIFAALGTRVLAKTSTLLDAAKDAPITGAIYMRAIAPIALLFAGSLVLSNKAYLYLSVSFIQMLKAFNPVAILLISFTFRIQSPSTRLLFIVLAISFGVCLASYGELRFDLRGFIIQAMAPCALLTISLLPITEGLAPFMNVIDQVGLFHLLANAMTAFLLNIAAVWLVGIGGGLVLTLAGVFKDILLVTGSVLIFHSDITSIQVIGYTIALAGLIVFKTTGSK
ncbi:SubName: Full=Related to triose phosphate/3-phosphoglycerate/phosphate translocator {ECO:0000313/EMBL:CCA67303.1} [Serendipita indica DSM 11827]|nr:SubName: Full=Related to triose phosphate/3-phosphoglycerate/phosphate translocator {ECO:0000313/EMBL:CCA67303.1} [Serendipita indica DSM 11827]